MNNIENNTQNAPEEVKATAEEVKDNEKMPEVFFEDLDLSDNVLDALYDMRFEKCTPVQAKCIPPILENHDVLGVAQIKVT